MRIKPEGLALVAPPGLSLAADSSSPPLKVPGCFVDGFEVRPLRAGDGEKSGVREGSAAPTRPPRTGLGGAGAAASPPAPS